MKILNEAKENLPISFLTDFISKGWEEVGYLKADIEAIKQSFKGTKKVEELIQSLVDAYLVCIGQLEAHIHDKNYIEYPEESGLGETKKETLEEELNITVKEDSSIETKEGVKESVTKQRIKLNNRSLKEAIIDDLGEALYTPGIWGVEFVGEECICFDNEQEARDYFYSLTKSDIYRDSEGIELFKVINEDGDTDTIDVISIYDEEEEKVAEDREEFEYFVDFDEPDLTQPKLTDDDLYNN